MKLMNHRFDIAFIAAWLLVFFADRIVRFLGIDPKVLMAVAITLLCYAAVGLVPRVWSTLRNIFGGRN
jgi:Na+-driven multidrug efflux pump